MDRKDGVLIVVEGVLIKGGKKLFGNLGFALLPKGNHRVYGFGFSVEFKNIPRTISAKIPLAVRVIPV